MAERSYFETPPRVGTAAPGDNSEKAASTEYVDDAVAGVGSYTDEQAQDAIGTVLVDSATVDFTYTDATPAITAIVIDGSITPTKLSTAAKTVAIPFIIDGGGAVITTGIKGDVEIPFAGTITGWTLLADQSGSITIDTWKDTYGNFPPTVADTMWGTKPALSTQTKNQATGLSIAVTAGDIIRFNVDSAATLTRALLSFTMTKS